MNEQGSKLRLPPPGPWGALASQAPPSQSQVGQEAGLFYCHPGQPFGHLWLPPAGNMAPVARGQSTEEPQVQARPLEAKTHESGERGSETGRGSED